jgi:hypothetical protein
MCFEFIWSQALMVKHVWCQTLKTSVICGKQGGGNNSSLRSEVVFFF